MTARTAARNFAAALVICAGMVSVGPSAQACKTAETEFSTRLRKTAEGCGHPLCGQIHVIDKAALARDASCGGDPLISLTTDWLGARLSGVVIVGETHDNPLHHELQADLLRSDPVPVADDKAGVVFEQFRSDQQPVFDKIAAEPTPPTLEEFKRVTNWEKSGWQQYKYDPLLQAAIDLRLPLYAGDVPREAIMKVAKEGPEALPADERARLKLDTPLGAKLDEASLIEIEENHCGLMPKEALKPMAFAQRYRDAHLADATLKAVGKHGSAILITAIVPHLREELPCVHVVLDHLFDPVGKAWKVKKCCGARICLPPQSPTLGKRSPGHPAHLRSARSRVGFMTRANSLTT